MSRTPFSEDDIAFENGVENSVPSVGGLLASTRSNALSNKVTSILSSSYADPEIRTALDLLDAKGIQNDADTRRDLRLDAQKQVIDCDVRIVQDFGKVAEQLQRLGALLETLNKTCDEMRQRITLARQDSAPVLEEATALMNSKYEIEVKQKILDAFKTRFIISEEDLASLTSSLEPVNDRFFAILMRVKQIHSDCETLLGSENQRLGLELMEQTSRNQDAAYKKLYNWVQKEFKGLDLEDPHISGSIRRALRVLSERPTLFQNCLDFFAEARQHTLAAAFQSALTDSTAGSTKAIEFSTHDLLRYVGDMLAWVHSATVSEKEALEGLFIADEDEIAKGMKAGRIAEPWSRIQPATEDSDKENEEDDGETTFDGHKALNTLVSRNLADVCQTLQNRIGLAVHNSDEPVLIYKALNLLNFYQTMFTRQVGPDTALTSCISTLESLTMSHFEHVVQEENASLVAAGGTVPTPDLATPSFLTTTLTQLSEVSRTKGPVTTVSEFEHMFSTLLSTSLTACAEMCHSIHDPRRRLIFKLNYVSAVADTLRTITTQTTDAAAPSLDRATEEIASTKESLVEATQVSLLDDSGVGTLLQDLQSRIRDLERRRRRRRRSSTLSSSAKSTTEPTSPGGGGGGGDDDDDDDEEEQEEESLTDYLRQILDPCARRLDTWLPFALMTVQENLKSISDRGMAKEIVEAAVEEFAEQFEELEALLERVDEKSEKHGDGGGIRELYPRTGTEVRALLS